MLKVGVIVARFQVPSLHAGHIELLNVAGTYDRKLVLLGVSDLDGHCAENPLLFDQRCSVVRRYVKDAQILPLFNMKDNKAWSKQVDSIIYALFPVCEAELIVGPDSVVPACYTGKAGFRRVPAVSDQNGTKLRANIVQSDHMEFIRGQIFALGMQYPQAYQCVDIAVMHNKRDVLMIQRADTGEWCLPGGFVDPEDPNLEHAARRELREETGIVCEDFPRYITSLTINDWRFRGRDKIMSALFAIQHAWGTPKLNHECTNWRWYTLGEDDSFIADSHKPFISALKQEYKIA